MSDRTRKAVWPIIVGVILAAMVVVYVVSIGPAEVPLENGYLPPNVYLTFYYPIFKACEWSPAIEHAVDWYIMMWTPTT